MCLDGRLRSCLVVFIIDISSLEKEKYNLKRLENTARYVCSFLYNNVGESTDCTSKTINYYELESVVALMLEFCRCTKN
jgi:hypothetical protein